MAAPTETSAERMQTHAESTAWFWRKQRKLLAKPTAGKRRLGTFSQNFAFQKPEVSVDFAGVSVGMARVCILSAGVSVIFAGVPQKGKRPVKGSSAWIEAELLAESTERSKRSSRFCQNLPRCLYQHHRKGRNLKFWHGLLTGEWEQSFLPEVWKKKTG